MLARSSATIVGVVVLSFLRILFTELRAGWGGGKRNSET